MGRGMIGGGWCAADRNPAMTDPAQLDGLKSEIGITTAQEPAWTGLEDHPGGRSELSLWGFDDRLNAQ